MNLPRELIEAVRRHQVVPFVGAGVSMGVKRALFPSWSQLLEGLAVRLEQEALPEPMIAQVRQRIASGDFLEAAELAFQEMGAYRFNRFLRERLRVSQPEDADLSVVRALWALRPEVMLTTNYDDVLLWGREGTEPIANDQEDELNLMDAEASPDTPRLWYLHGTIHRLSTLILGGTDYARLYGDGSRDGRYSQYTNALVRLRDWIRSRPFLYVGFSFSDPHVLKQIEHVLGITKGRQVPSFALMKKGTLERGALWPRYNIQLVEYEDHGPPLAAGLEALARAAFGAGDAMNSRDSLEKMVELEPENVASKIKLAELYARENLTQDAAQEFKKAAEYLKRNNRMDDWFRVAERLSSLEPDNVALARDLAQQYLARGDQKRALARLQVCFKADRRDIETLDMLAQAFHGLRKTEKTIIVYKELAKIYQERGRNQDAANIWNRVAALESSDSELAKHLAQGPFAAAPAASPVPRAVAHGVLFDPPSIVARPSPEVFRSPAPAPQATVTAPAPAAPASVAAPAPTGTEQFSKLLKETDIYVKYGLHDKALAHLRKIFVSAPENLDAHEKAYQIYVASGNAAQAGEQLLNVLRLCTRRAEVQRAQPYLATILQQNPGHSEVPAFLAVLWPDAPPSALAGSQVETVGEDAILADSNDEEIVVADAPEDALQHPPGDELALLSAPEAPEFPEAPLVPLDPPHVRRAALEAQLTGILQREHRLVLLAPEEGGARSLARRLAEPYGERVTWLAPPNLPDCTEAEYCRALAGDAAVTGFDALVAHLSERAVRLGREHLLVLRYEWGPLGHLDALGQHLGRLLDERSKVTFHLLVAGGERAAWLLHHAPKFSAYRDAPRRELPDFTLDEVRQFLDTAGLDGNPWAADLHTATGGHLGLLKEALLGAGTLDEASVTERLVRNPSVRGALQERLREDARNGHTGRKSCRFVLETLLEGRPVEALGALEHRTEHPEVRLYFSGLVRSDTLGRTVARCRAVELAARDVLARRDVRP